MNPTIDLTRYLPTANSAAQLINRTMINELRLQPPSRYGLVERNGMVWLLAAMDPLRLGKNVAVYSNERVAHHLSTLLSGRPVILANHTGLRYAVLLSNRPRLPKMAGFPGGQGKQDVFRLGIGLRGEVMIPARRMLNVLIGASQGSGKSNLLHLLVHQMHSFGWKLYLADPQSHTFNPDVWNNGLAAMAVAGSAADLTRILDQLNEEIADRIALFRQAASGGIPPADLDEYNLSTEPLPRMGLVIDEANTYLMDKAVMKRMADLLRQGRKWGLHVVIAGHDWRSQDISRELSAMLQTRIALAVADDTSGQVVLDNHRWGTWVVGEPPGRGVMKAEGKFTPMQFYFVAAEQEREWLVGPVKVEPLTETERSMVRYALEVLDGAFPIRDISTQFVEQGMTFDKVRTLAELWQARSWLDRPKDAVSARRVTPKLADLAGISLTGTQGTQALTGGSQGTQEALTGHTGLLTGSHRQYQPEMEDK